MRWAFYGLLCFSGLIAAEAISGSTIHAGIDVFLLVIYGTHYLLIFDYLWRQKALTLRALAAGGLVVGIGTESLMTKVIWNPPWEIAEEPVTRILGLGLWEVGFIVNVWHVWMTAALPFALVLYFAGIAEVQTARWRYYILYAFPFTNAFSIGLYTLYEVGALLLLIGVNVPIFVGVALLYHRQAQQAGHTNPDLSLKRNERRALWAILFAQYALLIPHRMEAFPPLVPFLLGMGLLVGSVALLLMIGRRDAGRTRLRDRVVIDYTPASLGRWLIYFLAVLISLWLVIGWLQPLSGSITVAFAILLIVPGNIYLCYVIYRVLFVMPDKELAS